MQLAVGGITRMLADIMLEHKTTNINSLKLSPNIKELLLAELERLSEEISDLEEAIRDI